MSNIWPEKPERPATTDGLAQYLADLEAYCESLEEKADKLGAVEKWHKGLWELCNWYLDNDRYIYMGLVQKFGELEKILEDKV